MTLLAAGFTGCEADVISDPSLRGDIVGFAGLKDARGERPVDQSGIEIRLKGKDVLAISDEEGRWQLSDVEAGIYDIVISKPGFASTFVRAYQFVGGGTAYIANTVDLIESKRDTFVVSSVSYAPAIKYVPGDSTIDSIEVPNQYLVIEGDVSFEDKFREKSSLYIQPYFSDLSIIPSLNHAIGEVVSGKNVIKIPVQQIMQYGYPAGEPIEVTFTTRMNNTHYYEPSTRRRIVTDPHNLLKLNTTIPPQ